MTETASALWLNSVFAGFDSSVTIAVHRLYDIGGGFFTPFFEFISILGKGGAFLIFLSLISSDKSRIPTAVFPPRTIPAVFLSRRLQMPGVNTSPGFHSPFACR